MPGVVLWCDSDVRVERSATLLKDAGFEVRAFSEPEELLEVYAERAPEVVAVISSMMRSGGRQERGEMDALGMFAQCRRTCYSAGARAPVYAVISTSVDREEAFKYGADVVVLGKRQKVQEIALAKIRQRQEGGQADRIVVWCDSNPGVSKMAGKFREAGCNLVTFQGTEEWLEYLKSSAEEVVAVISSSMESGGRAEQGLLSGFQGFAKAREFLEETSGRPLFAFVSGSGKTTTCYQNGADIVACKDNGLMKERHPSANLWDMVASDVIASLKDETPTARTRAALETPADLGFPEHWKARTDDFSEMEPVDDPALCEALQNALRETFKRGDDGAAYSTRDRSGGKPRDFRLAQAYRIEDSHAWRRYALCRAAVGECPPFSDVSRPGGPVKTAAVEGLPPLLDGANEAYLFHGTNPEAASGIIHTGFRIDLAGTAAGCAFGRGAYLAEASTKSDEYAKCGELAVFSKMYAMLLCRTVLGRVVRVEEFYYNDEETQRIVDEDIIADGKYHCLLGDREACVGTYREFILFNRDHIYPEFVLLYHRD